MQIRNIQNLIRLTKENLEALNDEFGKHQHPPSMYLQVCTEDGMNSCWFVQLCVVYMVDSVYHYIWCKQLYLLCTIACTAPGVVINKSRKPIDMVFPSQGNIKYITFSYTINVNLIINFQKLTNRSSTLVWYLIYSLAC